jgi:hypothetical protein
MRDQERQGAFQPGVVDFRHLVADRAAELDVALVDFHLHEDLREFWIERREEQTAQQARAGDGRSETNRLFVSDMRENFRTSSLRPQAGTLNQRARWTYRRAKESLMNQTVNEIYEEYRDKMAQTLGLEEYAPHLFSDDRFTSLFEKKVERLDALIELYASLVAASKN